MNALRNTVILGLFNLTIGFAAPVLFALLITSVPYKRFRRAMQTICYLPNFVASVVVVTLMQNFLSENGAITNLLTTFGLERQDWLANPNPPAFWLIYTFMAVWQGFGYGSIIFVSSISNISGDLYEAAAIDGANRWQQVRKITFPCILPMVVMLFVIQVAVVFKAGYDKILLMYTPSTRGVADTLYTYTYRLSFGESRPNYGVSAASGLFQSVVSTVLLFGSNWISRKVTNLAVF